jgi:hypothetical protein
VHKIFNPQVPLEGSVSEGLSRGGRVSCDTLTTVIKLLRIEATRGQFTR